MKDAPRAEFVRPSKSFEALSTAPVGNTPSERIKNRISVRDFVSHYVDLDAAGRGLCPFHDDHVYSFGVNIKHNFWHCFAGCGGGSVIDFWMRWRRLNNQDDSFIATIQDLAKMLLD
ncbi:MAG: hypothetical protein IPM16_10480 [Chloroflexi bacterium]|nr:hypothetical protein [Chloroflexota bacterium]